MTTVERNAPAASARRKTRLIGVDVARFLAVLGMFNIHFGVPFAGGDVEIWFAQISSGRATALFTFLAGVSLAMLSGRREPPTGDALRATRVRIAVRAGVLILVGFALAKATEATGFLLTIIIAFYGMYFLLAVPFVGLRARGLTIAALVTAVVGPQLSFLVRWSAIDTPLAGTLHAVNMVDPGHLLAELGLFDLLLLDFYPAASYLALVLAGMAVGRLDLRAATVRKWLALGGTAVAVLVYTSSALLVWAVGARPAVSSEGTVPTRHPDWLLATTPHSGTTFELLGSLGIAAALLAGSLELADRSGRWIKPFAAAGSMALTLYALHALVLAWQVVVGGWPLSGVPPELADLASATPSTAIPPDMPAFPPDRHEPTGLTWLVNAYIPEIFVIAALVLATFCKRYFDRGPLEAAVSESVRWLTTRKTRS